MACRLADLQDIRQGGIGLEVGVRSGKGTGHIAHRIMDNPVNYLGRSGVASVELGRSY
jgi:hypothetical protein